MAENNSANGGISGPEAANDDRRRQPQVNVLVQYVRDLSLESPNALRFRQGPGANPNLQLNFQVEVKNVSGEVFEVALLVDVDAKSDEGVLYKLELVYAGAFALVNLPAEAVQPVLYIECPSLLFPFARRIVADLTRESGFPPLFLDPIDFGALYRQGRVQQSQTAS